LHARFQFLFEQAFFLTISGTAELQTGGGAGSGALAPAGTAGRP